MELKELKRHRHFEGWTVYYEHESKACGCPMRFSVFLPPLAERRAVPVLYWLSGLTCTEENFTAKAGAQRLAAQHGLMLVAPDTSPRGLDLPGEDESWDFGTGAGFYVNAAQAPWADHYRMYDYVVSELPATVKTHLPAAPGRQSVFGHSMGGHGALVAALRNPDQYRSVSAFSPICAPSQCPWGQKAFSRYLGDDRNAWREYDACALIEDRRTGKPILVEQGADDNFLEEQLMPDKLKAACAAAGVSLTLNIRPGYDHSYFFIASFIDEHIAYHARALAN